MNNNLQPLYLAHYEINKQNHCRLNPAWIGFIKPLASVTIMLHDSRTPPSGFCHCSHKPAKASGLPACDPINHGCLALIFARACYQPSAGTKQRRCRKAARKAGLLATVSARALMVLKPIFTSFAQDGIKPHRARPKLLFPACCLTMATVCEGATL